MMRVFLLVNPSLSGFRQKVFGHLLSSDGIEIVGGLIDTRPRASGWKKIKRELKRGRGGFVFVQVLGKLFGRSRDDSVDAATFFAGSSARFLACDDFRSEEAISFARECRPDVVFRSAFGIIREPWLSMSPLGVLSYHHGDLREVRGQPVGFWEVYRGLSEMGVTVQRLNERLDAGAIIREMSVPIGLGDSWSTVYERAYAVSDRLAIEAMTLLSDDSQAGVYLSDDDMGKVYTTPNLRQWLTMHLRVLGRRIKVWMGGSRDANERARGVHS